MPELFRNSSPGALTLEQARELEIQRERERRAQRLAQVAVPPAASEQTQIEEVVVTGRPSTIPLNVYPHQSAFLEALNGPITRMAESYGLNPENVLGLTAKESGWFQDPNAIANNNPFGVNIPGTKQLRRFDSLDDAYSYWGKVFGEPLRGKFKTEDFVDGLQHLPAGNYNSDDPEYYPNLLNTIDSVKVKRPLWQQGR